ncbi:polyadenylate-binding protein 4-like [Paramacrobiotus metropolitanus]|uniref:polyadenylate-binding protein 4-like n=1 Tax=Paramacrobiotus metropolitanus TaxID=2943436 RepID=UPI00244650A3|nr:polyadenylate-binding protein 4-like [Paramacrobiotus metropolitanus]
MESSSQSDVPMETKLESISQTDHTKASMNPLASLEVNYFDPSVTDEMLLEKFSTFGPVISARICNDFQVEGRSLRYALVDFENFADAKRAKDNLATDRNMSIRWVHCHTWISRKPQYGIIVIKNLQDTVDEKYLRGIFSGLDAFVCCKVLRDERAKSTGFAFVLFQTEAAAQSALEKASGELLNDKEINMELFKIPTDTSDQRLIELPPKHARATFTNVFIKDFGEDVDNGRLWNLFKQFGNVSSHTVIKDENGHSRGYGFVEFQMPESAEQAVNEMNGTEVSGKVITVARAQSRSERQHIRMMKKLDESRHTLYVKNLEDSVDDEGLRKMFEEFGTVTSAQVAKDTGRSRGFGFVSFASVDAARKAEQEMQGKVFGNKALSIAPALDKELRQPSHSKNMFIHTNPRYWKERRQQHSHSTPPLRGFLPWMYGGMSRSADYDKSTKDA